MSPQATAEAIASSMGTSLRKLKYTYRLNMWLMKVQRVIAAELRLMGCSWPVVGEILGRDHTTIMANVGCLPSKQRKRSA